MITKTQFSEIISERDLSKDVSDFYQIRAMFAYKKINLEDFEIKITELFEKMFLPPFSKDEWSSLIEFIKTNALFNFTEAVYLEKLLKKCSVNYDDWLFIYKKLQTITIGYENWTSINNLLTELDAQYWVNTDQYILKQSLKQFLEI
jgi:hypothetical protein